MNRKRLRRRLAKLAAKAAAPHKPPSGGPIGPAVYAATLIALRRGRHDWAAVRRETQRGLAALSAGNRRLAESCFWAASIRAEDVARVRADSERVLVDVERCLIEIERIAAEFEIIALAMEKLRRAAGEARGRQAVNRWKQADAADRRALVASAYTPGMSAEDVRLRLERLGDHLRPRTVRRYLKEIRGTRK